MGVPPPHLAPLRRAPLAVARRRLVVHIRRRLPQPPALLRPRLRAPAPPRAGVGLPPLQGVPPCCREFHRAAWSSTVLQGVPPCCREFHRAAGSSTVLQGVSPCYRDLHPFSFTAAHAAAPSGSGGRHAQRQRGQRRPLSRLQRVPHGLRLPLRVEKCPPGKLAQINVGLVVELLRGRRSSPGGAFFSFALRSPRRAAPAGAHADAPVRMEPLAYEAVSCEAI